MLEYPVKGWTAEETCWKKAFAKLVFVLFEPEKFNKHKQIQSSGGCPQLKAWVSMLLVPCAGFSGPKEWDGSKRYPAFF